MQSPHGAEKNKKKQKKQTKQFTHFPFIFHGALRERLRTHKVFTKDQCFYLKLI